MQTLRRNRPLARRTLIGAALALTATFGAACSDSNEPGSVEEMVIVLDSLSHATTNLQRGITFKLVAVPINENDNFVNIPITWSSSDNAKATVDANGLVTTVAGGNVTITASAGGKSAEFPINIQFPIGTVTVGPTTPTIRQEGTVALSATLLGTDNAAAIGRTVTWSSSAPAVATVNASTGVVTGVSNGTATITATSEGVSGSQVVTVNGSPLVATVTVTGSRFIAEGGGTVQLTQTPRSAANNTVPGTTALWSSSNTAAITVSATGLATAVSSGSATITATVDNGIGTNVNGTWAMITATGLTSGVGMPVAVTSGNFKWYTINVPTGTTSLQITATGGTGDGDLYIFAPTASPSAFNSDPNANAFTGTTFVNAAGGTAENRTISNPAAGNWGIAFVAWGGDVNVTGATLTATRTP